MSLKFIVVNKKGAVLVTPCLNENETNLIAKMEKFGYSHVKTYTEELPPESKIEKLMELIADNDNANMDLKRAFLGMLTTSYCLGKGTL